MSYDLRQFGEFIYSTISELNFPDVLSATNLLLGTAAVESELGKYLKQTRGPALGAFQIEPWVEVDLWETYLEYRPDFVARIYSLTDVSFSSPERLQFDLKYQIVVARFKYYRVPYPLPYLGINSDQDKYIQQLAEYWKRHWNTPQGKGTTAKFIEKFQKYIGGIYWYES